MAFLIPIAAGIAIGAVANKIYGHFSKPPPSPPPPPSPEVSQKLMIKAAQEKLGMDIENRYNFGVCGSSGTGKSTFINSIRVISDVENSDAYTYSRDGPARVGINETTMEPTQYCWPNNEFPYLTIWDLPGGGTAKHPYETYFNDKTLYAFDCLLLLKSGRFTKLDVEIYRQALQYKIPIAVVLTKADNDIKSRLRLKTGELRRKLQQEECDRLIADTVQMLKNDVKKELIEAGCSEPKPEQLFVVSAPSYRDQKLGFFEDVHCVPLETERLIMACCNAAIFRRTP